MEVYLIRHTTTATEKGVCYGQSDVLLAESFQEEARAMHAKLQQLSEDCLLFSSPLQRCVRLAETFARPIILDDRLKEINFGEWENCRFDEIDADQLKHWADNFVTVAPPKGESFNCIYQRASQFWEELLTTQAVQQVVVITHAGVIRALLAYILALPRANAFKFQVDVGSIHKFRYVNDYTYVAFLNH